MPLSPNDQPTTPDQAIAAVAQNFFTTLSQRMPVCLSSDEFHYFPQVSPSQHSLQHWDDFSPAAVSATIADCRCCLKQLSRIEAQLKRQAVPQPVPSPPAAAMIDIHQLEWMATIISEQLRVVGCHTTQATFYLTIAGIGLAQAYEAGTESWHNRLKGLPGFLAGARANLRQVPRLFRDQGLKMAATLERWLARLPFSADLAPSLLPNALTAVQQFQAHLQSLATTEAFRLDPGLYAHVAHSHLGSGLDPDAMHTALADELKATEDILRHEAERLAPGCSWQDTVRRMTPVHSADCDPYELYRNVIRSLEAHCLEQGWIAPDQAAAAPVRVAPVPDYLVPIRSAAAYSMAPGHPPTGGTFYLMPGDLDTRPGADMHLLCAHETYPGHHLLDTARWQLPRTLRRHLEFPLIYEGWASFAEELLFDTAFCTGARDRLLMAKRRYYRALRGKVDLMLNRGTWSRAQAAGILVQAGYTAKTAAGMVTRYALKPGYQLCYTLGRQYFRKLKQLWTRKGGTLADFCRLVLSEGEICPADLEPIITVGPPVPHSFLGTPIRRVE